MSAESLDRIPRPMIVAVGVMLAVTLAGTAALRLGDVPPTARGPAAEAADARLSVVLRRAPEGTLLLSPEGAELARVAAGQDGFLRGLLRVVDRQRMQHGLAPEGPLEIVRWPGGHLALVDPATGWRAELVGFGADNYAAFATLVSGIIDTAEDGT